MTEKVFYFICDVNHIQYQPLRALVRAQVRAMRPKHGPALTVAAYNLAGDRAILKAVEDSPAWRVGINMGAVLLTLEGREAHLNWYKTVYADPANGWVEPEAQ